MYIVCMKSMTVTDGENRGYFNCKFYLDTWLWTIVFEQLPQSSDIRRIFAKTTYVGSNHLHSSVDQFDLFCEGNCMIVIKEIFLQFTLNVPLGISGHEHNKVDEKKLKRWRWGMHTRLPLSTISIHAMLWLKLCMIEMWFGWAYMWFGWAYV